MNEFYFSSWCCLSLSKAWEAQNKCSDKTNATPVLSAVLCTSVASWFDTDQASASKGLPPTSCVSVGQIVSLLLALV